MFNSLKYPIIQAPMAGGVSTVDLALAVSQNGGLGFLAAGYKTPEVIEKEILECNASGLPFGVNLFVPQNDTVDEALYLYKLRLEEDFQIKLTIQEPHDDFWAEKLELVMKYKVPYVSFTFGCPSKEIIEQLKKNSSHVIVTVTNLSEAKIAENNGADAICLQGVEAGGHRATFQNVNEDSHVPLMNLINTIHKEIQIPIIAAGGIINGKDIHLALSAGAEAVQLGTAFLCTEESGANFIYKKALQSDQFSETALTRAFTGRLARGLKNDFMSKYESLAPAIYPAVHTLTQPIRAKALREKNPHAMSLWASTRFKEVKQGTVKDVFEQLIKELNLCQS
ncbi:NAD(P)H-dependent flavin oxidoreductase [Neobacillus sp.]|jgi:nitronate monooxygenase|uniref:NAD(P)H-dependent flavin oxidoreductase n=1 Tax=Neobacillus sp. TaxID=2675273 RepID=UPI0035B52709